MGVLQISRYSYDIYHHIKVTDCKVATLGRNVDLDKGKVVFSGEHIVTRYPGN